MKNIILLSTVLLSALAEAQGSSGERGQVGSGSNRDNRGSGYSSSSYTAPTPTWSPLPNWDEPETTRRPSSTSRRTTTTTLRQSPTPTWAPIETTTRRPSTTSRRPTPTPTTLQPTWNNPQPTWNQPQPSWTQVPQPSWTQQTQPTRNQPQPSWTQQTQPTRNQPQPTGTQQTQPTWNQPQPSWTQQTQPTRNQPQPTGTQPAQPTWGGNPIPTTWNGAQPSLPNWGTGGFQFPAPVPTTQPWNPATPYTPNSPILCDACPQTYCLPGENECECANTAALSCWVQTGFSCLRPQLRDCGAEIPPTDETSEFPPCGSGYAACSTGTVCDTSMTTGCFDVFGFGNCIGVCVPTSAPYVPDTPAEASPTSAAPTASPTGVATGSCRGVGYDVDCPVDQGVCISDPKFPIGANVAGVCVSATQSCGGVRQASCSNGKVCLDDPRDQCDPNTGEGCLGICV